MNPYRNLEDKIPHSIARGGAALYASRMEKKSKSPWEKKPCGCIKGRLHHTGNIVVRCGRHADKPVKDGWLLCHFDEGGMLYPDKPLPPQPPRRPVVSSPPRLDLQRVYFARLGNRIKIGVSEDPKARAQALNAELIGSVHGGRARELELHREFAELRTSGEWFKAKPRLLSRIEELLR